MSPNPWFICPQTRPEAHARLFLFPYAGGGPAVFNKWTPQLPRNLEAWTAHYPGRGSRHHETPIRQMTPLVEGLAQAMQPLLDKPYAFFGHSLGALVAYELARFLCRNHFDQPKILFVSACGAPHRPDPHPPIHRLSDVEFINSLQELNGIPSELMQRLDVIQLFLHTLRADFEIVETYHHDAGESVLPFPIVAFGGLDDPRVSRERLEDWCLQTSSSFRSQYFSGDHFFLNTSHESLIHLIVTEVANYAKN